MSSPSERFAAARRRSRYPALTGFRAQYPFALDDFQVEACQALEDGYAVLVCAPTGAGKTLVGEFAAHLALQSGQKCFYTTPIKALSNQKYNDFVARYGPGQVGLLTGDNSINGDAPIVVMTTEVLRNMLYVSSTTLADLGYVVMDEVHYLGDRFRGAVWEEVIIHLPESVRLVSLSATVSNAEEFGAWLVTVRGETRVVVHEERPVPLWQHLLVGTRLFDLLAEDGSGVDPELNRYLNERMRYLDPGAARRGGSRQLRGWRPPHRPDVISRLDREGLLPAITFVFSRAGCDAAVRQCVYAGLWLTDEDERNAIDALIDERTAGLAAEDLEVLGYWEWRDGLRRGVAAHHAGLIPAFKETVEELFVRGLVRAVFATETLALGINMPARTVVLERLTKFNGEAHVDVTPGEYTQFTGRAGRRGIDVEGHAVVLWSPEIDPGRVAGLASTRTYPLRSSFRPSYNMAVNLVGQMGRDAARTLLESSFAQFQADRGVAGLSKQIRRNEQTQRELGEQMRCERGDFAEYAGLRRQLSEREALLSREGARKRKAAVVQSLEQLRPGDVIRVPAGRRAGLAVVLDAGVHPRDDPHPLVVTEARWGGRLSVLDFPVAVEVLGSVRVPKHANYRSPQERRDLASGLRALDLPPEERSRRRKGSGAADDEQVIALRAALRAHPCHDCPDREEHARWGERFSRLQRENDDLRRRIEGRTGSLGRTFDRIALLLTDRGYLAGDETTPPGRMLARIWSDSDLLVAECLRAGAWDGLAPADLAAVVSTLVYEARREERLADRMPTVAVRDALVTTARIWAELADEETAHGLVHSREPELGFVWAIHRWARGDSLGQALDATVQVGAELSAGDFIRWCKQLLDLLDQIAVAPSGSGDEPPLARPARAAIAAVRRGVVAQSMMP
ncbi:DEAD/DEAH box helicase [Jatrophihabitans cynanchi]|uniref:DEAD/DEAH box helicase n=1 Tax=Jatrophihabitans cynanchi TaxID=2944128 RepID=A0ABY7JZ96_9ACTN|nr:DEAD/DEAH box helicase [Jatrophihabitans sp. SB3-54]WAX57045.1 DEAD/DEAH box helicase [Jatrophihabitans sp. SB3-54]